MTTYGERLRIARERAGLTQPELAKAAGIGQGQISKLERGLRAGTTKNFELATATGVRQQWLVKGTGPMADPQLVDLEGDPNFPAIPLVKFKISAGVTGFQIGHLEPGSEPIAFRLDWFQSRGYDPMKLYAIQVTGQSMETSLFEGDIIVVNTAAVEPVDGEVFALNYDGEIVVKRTIRTAGAWVLASDNPDKRRYPDKPIHESVFVIGRVVHRQSERI